MQRYPLSAAAIASPTPVLPDVGSTIVPPGFSFPSRSAASIIASPIRSLFEPPGFMNSSLARIVPGTSPETRSSRTIGVEPTRSMIVGYSRAIAAGSLPLRGSLTGPDHRGGAMRITTIGKGNIGGGLAGFWRGAGHEVTELGRDGGDASDAD